MSQLLVGVAMLGCAGAYATWNARYVVRWLAKMACPHCGKRKLMLDARRSHNGATAFRCAACEVELVRHRGVLIERAAFDAGAREAFPKARLL